MSRRQRRVRERSLRQRASHEKTLRRRGRLAAARPAAAAATAAALTLAGGTLPAAAAGSGTIDSAASAARSGVLGRPDARVVSASVAGCGDAHTPASNPQNLANVRGKLFFTADDGVHGTELWKSNGTKAGTVLVKDIKTAGAQYEEYGPESLTAVGGRLFFTADDGVHGNELWTSDGTKAGTVLVKDIDPRGRHSHPSNLTDVGGRLFFTADDGVHGNELWTSDGTKAGTVLVRDIKPRSAPDDEYGPDGPNWLTDVGGKLFFTADDGVHGSELWTSDGTKAGTVLVKDIDPEPRADYDFGPLYLTDVGGRLFFSADDGTHGNELWTSDGTEAGTVLVKNIHPDAYDSDPSWLTVVGGKLFFSARDGIHGAELWTSDGTEEGTVLVTDIRPVARSSSPSSLTVVGGQLMFFADDGSRGAELWTSDGTEAGTVLVKDVNPGAGDGASESEGYGNSSPTAVGGRLFFAADDGTHGTELWASDGTEAGTVLVKDLKPGAGHRYGDGPTELTDVGGKLFFAARDGIHGSELWSSDGTTDGTAMIKDVNQGGGFTVARQGTSNLRKATLRLKVSVAGAGKLVVGPASGSLIKTTRQNVRAAGATTATLTPTKAGMSKLRQALRRAHRHGRSVGKLSVRARFTFTPCGGTPSSQVRRYTLKLK
ncbi:MAG: ELWxxDGT repeat protein [Nocardioidaceae bacterium]